jgi:hypothetical protein
VLSTGNARKKDGLDALATALAAWRNERLPTVDPEAESDVLRLLSERREDLVAERTRALNRLHGVLLLGGKGVAQLVSCGDVYVLVLYEEVRMGMLIRWLVRLVLFRVLVGLWRIVRRR